MNYEIMRPTAYPESAPPGPVLITIPIRAYVSGYVTVRMYVYEGSFWPWHGTLLDTQEQGVWFNAGETKDVQFMHHSSEGTIDRRDVGVLIFDEWSPELAKAEFDDVFYVTPVAPPPDEEPPEVVFSGVITRVEPSEFVFGEPIDLSIDFKAYCESLYYQVNGWQTRLRATLDGLADSDMQWHLGRDGSRTGETLNLGAMPDRNLSGTLILEGRGITIPEQPWQVLDERSLVIRVVEVPIPPEVPPEEKFPWLPVALIGGGVVIAGSALIKPKKKGS